MNDELKERIRALAVEAGIELQSHTGILGRVNITTAGSQGLDKMERFAQAVARDCVDICAAHQEGGIGGWKHNTPQDCGLAIRARYGLTD